MSTKDDLATIAKLADRLFERFGLNDGEWTGVRLELGTLPGEDDPAIIVEGGQFYLARSGDLWAVFLPIDRVTGKTLGDDLEEIIGLGITAADVEFAPTRHAAAALIVSYWLEAKMLAYLEEIDPEGVESPDPDNIEAEDDDGG